MCSTTMGTHYSTCYPVTMSLAEIFLNLTRFVFRFEMKVRRRQEMWLHGDDRSCIRCAFLHL